MNELIFNVLLAVITALVGIVVKQLIPYLKERKVSADAALKRTRWAWVTEITDAAVRAVEQTAESAIHGKDKKDRAYTIIKDALQRQGLDGFLTDQQLLQLIEAAVQAMNAQAITIEEPVLDDVEDPEEEESTDSE